MEAADVEGVFGLPRSHLLTGSAFLLQGRGGCRYRGGLWLVAFTPLDWTGLPYAVHHLILQTPLPARATRTAKTNDKNQNQVTPPKAIQDSQADNNANSPPPAPRHSNRLRSIHSPRLKALEEEALRAPIEERAELSDSAGGLR